MKKTNIDNLGRVVIPSHYRKSLRLEKGDTIVMELVDGSIIIEPEKTLCKICNFPLKTTNDLNICTMCIGKIKRL